MPSGQFSHSAAYVSATIAHAALVNAVTDPIVPRLECGEPMRGLRLRQLLRGPDGARTRERYARLRIAPLKRDVREGVAMGTWVNFFIIFLVVLALIGVIAWLVRWLGGGTARRRQPRLAVIDSARIDGRRTLVLIRRDNVERLVMIGGPNDVVIEQNVLPAIGAPEPARRAASRSAVRAVEFSNQLTSAEVPPRPQPMQPQLPSTRKPAPPLELHPPQSVHDVGELRETLKALLND